jgi:MFS family permease
VQQVTMPFHAVSESPLSLGRCLRIFLPFAFGYFLSFLYRAVNSVLAPNLVRDIGVDPSDLGLLTAAYFISFAAFQLPLGVLLDRFGPRRIEAPLLVLAAVGAFWFGASHTLSGLVVGRALIGLGVSACLMAAFKAFVVWFPKQQLTQVNGFQMAAGGLGALTATAPVEAALALTDWRGVFTALSALTLAVAAVVFFVVPEYERGDGELRFSDQIRGIRTVFSSPLFRRIAPWTTMSQATFLALQGLWAGPWLRDVAGFSRPEVARTLLLMAAGMVAGFSLFGTVAKRLSRKGIPPLAVACSGMLTFAAVQVLLLCPSLKELATLLWVLFGFFGTSGILCFAALSQNFPPHLSGRVTTALNLLIFVGAFAAQWGVGSLIELFRPQTPGAFAAHGYQAAFGVLLTAQILALLWFFLSRGMGIQSQQ